MRARNWRTVVPSVLWSARVVPRVPVHCTLSQCSVSDEGLEDADIDFIWISFLELWKINWELYCSLPFSSFPVISCIFLHCETSCLVFLLFFCHLLPQRWTYSEFLFSVKIFSWFWVGLLRSLAHQLFPEETRRSWETFFGWFLYLRVHALMHKERWSRPAGRKPPAPGISAQTLLPRSHGRFCPVALSGKAIERESQTFATASYLMDQKSSINQNHSISPKTKTLLSCWGERTRKMLMVRPRQRLRSSIVGCNDTIQHR